MAKVLTKAKQHDVLNHMYKSAVKNVSHSKDIAV